MPHRAAAEVAEVRVNQQYGMILAQAVTPREAGSSVAILGQTLDGFIATRSGNSRYINGSAALVHLHRTRALCDAVIVGASTATLDEPRLTTRHVEGRTRSGSSSTRTAGCPRPARCCTTAPRRRWSSAAARTASARSPSPTRRACSACPRATGSSPRPASSRPCASAA